MRRRARLSQKCHKCESCVLHSQNPSLYSVVILEAFLAMISSEAKAKLVFGDSQAFDALV